MCAIIGTIHVLSVVNFSDKPVNLCAGTKIAAVSSLTPNQLSRSFNIAVIQHLSRNEKLRTVLNDLNVDAIKLDAPTKLKLSEMIDELIDVFAECDSDVGLTNFVFHEIDTGVSLPFRQPARRIPDGAQRNAVESEIQKLLENGMARPSTSPWASLVVMVEMKDNSWRICVDYRCLNVATKFDCFPLPRLDEVLDVVARCSVFSSYDLAMAYHQVLVAPSDVEKTAFITHAGLVEMTKMPFGLCNAPFTYQRLMSIVLRRLMTRISLAYLDDVIVYSRSHFQHLRDLRAFVERLLVAGLKLEPSKCQLFRDEVLYLDHVVNASGHSPNPLISVCCPPGRSLCQFATSNHSSVSSTFTASSFPILHI